MHYIYVIRNNINGKLYVGQTNDPGKRWSHHKYDARTVPDKMIISRAINKYGHQNFTFTTIEEYATLEEVNEAEAFWIEFLETQKLNIGYNIKPGGYNFLSTIPWNKGTKGIVKANSGSFTVQINWPTDQILLEMVNERGLGAVAREFNTDASNVNRRLRTKKLYHNRVPGNPKTQFDIGTNHPGAKLSSEQVLEIVSLYETGNYSQAELGRMFNVDRMNIKKIITGQTWSHLTGIRSK